jgi:hypothetical protein
MKTFINTLAILLVAAGIVAMAGSAGDCDGKCMDQANTLSEMIMAAFIGLCMFATGAAILIRNEVLDA